MPLNIRVRYPVTGKVILAFVTSVFMKWHPFSCTDINFLRSIIKMTTTPRLWFSIKIKPIVCDGRKNGQSRCEKMVKRRLLYECFLSSQLSLLCRSILDILSLYIFSCIENENERSKLKLNNWCIYIIVASENSKF